VKLGGNPEPEMSVVCHNATLTRQAFDSKNALWHKSASTRI
jgi:hypothetical protein